MARKTTYIATSIEFSSRDQFTAKVDGVPRPGQIITICVDKHTCIGIVESSTINGEVKGRMVRRAQAQ